MNSEPGDDPWRDARNRMVSEQIEKRGVRNEAVLEVLRRVPRHQFVPGGISARAYLDSPQPIGFNQTISQPYIVALMTELLVPEPTDRVLEIGTGSGYQAAVLAELVKEVYTIEIVPELAESARELLQQMGYDNVEVLSGDGYLGWPQKAPFDKIIVTAAPPEIPQKLVEQLKIGGRLVVPVGTHYQELLVLEKTESGLTRQGIIPVRFVPMVKGKPSS